METSEPLLQTYAQANLVAYNTSTGLFTYLSTSSFATTNIYNADGTLTGNRTVSLDNYSLTFVAEEADFTIQSGPEVSVNITNLPQENRPHQLFYDSGTGQLLFDETSSISSSPGGSDGQVQYNNGGVFGGASELFYNDSTGNVGIGTASPAQKLAVYESTNALLQVYNSGEVVARTNYIYAAASGNSFYSEAAANFRGVVRNDSGAYLQIDGGTSNNTYFNGNVGIGITNPAVKLHVDSGGIRATGTTSTTGQIDASPNFGAFRFYDGSTFYGGLGMGQWAGVGANTDIVQYLNTGVNYHVSNTTTPVLTVSSGGNVGIGTTSPGSKLVVVGGIGATGGSGYNTFGLGAWIGGDGTNGLLYMRSGASWVPGYIDASAIYLNAQSGGNVGIGTITPTQKLEIYNGNLLLNGASELVDPEIQLADGAGFGVAGAKLIYSNSTGYLDISQYWTDSSSGMRFNVRQASSGITAMTIRTSGNVGIGTINPGALLQVGYYNGTTDALIRLGVSYVGDRTSRGGITWHDSANTTGKIYTEYDGTMVSMVFGSLYNSGYNSNNLMIIRGNGNVGVGTTSPQAKLHVNAGAVSTPRGGGFTKFFFTGDNAITTYFELQVPTGSTGDILFSKASSGDYGIVGYSHVDDSMYFYTKSNPRMYITSTGNVGIGTATPLSKLHVNGDIRASLSNVNQVNFVAYNSGTGLFTYASTSSIIIATATNADNVFINEDSTNADQPVLFAESLNEYQPVRGEGTLLLQPIYRYFNSRNIIETSALRVQRKH
jgi:hypothetical protein